MLRFTRLLLTLAVFSLLLSPQSSDAATIIGGDSIGPDSSLTDFLGGFLARRWEAEPTYVASEPAVEISQDGSSLLDNMRLIVHGGETMDDGQLFFNTFQYRLKVWEKSAYLSGLEPSILADLGEPVGVTLIQQDVNHVVPDTSFGESSYDPGGFTRPSYDFQFDLTAAHVPGHPTQLLFDEPLAAGDYILAIQSFTGTGGFYISLSTASEGLLPYYFLNDCDSGEFNENGCTFIEHPRGTLLFQDPNALSYRWGWNIFETPAYADFDGNGIIDGLDFLKWQRGETPEMGSAEELALWEAQYGTTVPAIAAATVVPEPSALALILLGTTLLIAMKGIP